ncbi:MAG: zinc-ribbon domain-containing protein [Nitrospirae bacterium]|nr:zinc-ribbon domain-containing protein [Nitrospirota bacterium]
MQEERTEKAPGAGEGVDPKGDMHFCPKCGIALKEVDRYCPHCGHALDSSLTGPVQGGERTGRVREEELIAFIGNNAYTYIRKFRKFSVDGTDNFSATWHWPVFFTGFWWLLYRKMYLCTALYFVLCFIPYLNFFSWITFAVTGNYLYYRHCSRKIREIRTVQPSGDLLVILSQLGGVNTWVPLAAILISVLALISMMVFIPFHVTTRQFFRV